MTSRTRLRPTERREQLLDIGAQLFATRTLDELTIELLAEEAGVSRGLLYHYFGSKQEFHQLVCQHAADQLYAATEPPEGRAGEQLAGAMSAYVDYVVANQRGYRSLVRAAAGGDAALQGVYERAREGLIERTLALGVLTGLFEDSPRVRLIVRGWLSLAEETTLAWAQDTGGVSRAELESFLTASLPALVSATSA